MQRKADKNKCAYVPSKIIVCNLFFFKLWGGIKLLKLTINVIYFNYTLRHDENILSLEPHYLRHDVHYLMHEANYLNYEVYILIHATHYLRHAAHYLNQLVHR